MDDDVTAVPEVPGATSAPVPESAPDGVEAWILPSGEPQPRRSWAKPLVIGLSVLIAVAGMAVAGAAFFLRGSSDTITAMVPDDASVYATVYLDPALGQKLALRSLFSKFPATDTTGELNERLDGFFDNGLQDTGLSFRTDVRPWVGSQVGLVVKVVSSTTDTAALVASTDDAAAQKALAKVKGYLTSQGDSFTTQQHGGVTVTVGSRGSEVGPDVYAVVSHTVVIGTSAAIVDEVIDTAQGSHAAMNGTSEYSKVFDALPKDKLAFVYVNAAPLIKDLEANIDPSALAGPGPFTALEAYRGAGLAVSASSNGIAADFTIDVDSSKLTAQGRAALTVAAHPNTVLPFTPRTAFALFAGEGARPGFQQLLTSLIKDNPAVQQTTDSYGLTGPNNVVDHLTGDIGITAGPGDASGFPGLAFLAGTDDAAGMQRFLDTAAADIGPNLSSSGWQTEDYNGATITFLPISPEEQFLPISPAYTVADGMAIVAASPEEVKAVLDAHAGTNITDAENYGPALAGSVPNSTSLVYLDVEAIASTIREQLQPEDQANYDANVEPNIRHLKAFTMSGASTADQQSFRLFLLVR